MPNQTEEERDRVRAAMLGFFQADNTNYPVPPSCLLTRFPGIVISDGKIQYMSLQEKKLVFQTITDKGTPYALLPGRRLVIAQNRGLIEIADLNTGRIEQRLQVDECSPLLEVISVNEFLLFGYQNGTILIFNSTEGGEYQSGGVLRKSTENNQPVNMCPWPKKLCAVGLLDGTIELFDLVNKQLIETIGFAAANTSQKALFAADRYLISQWTDGTIHFLYFPTRECATLRTVNNPTVQVLATGQCLVQTTEGSRSRIDVYDITNDEKLKYYTLVGPQELGRRVPILCPNGNLLKIYEDGSVEICYPAKRMKLLRRLHRSPEATVVTDSAPFGFCTKPYKWQTINGQLTVVESNELNVWEYKLPGQILRDILNCPVINLQVLDSIPCHIKHEIYNAAGHRLLEKTSEMVSAAALNSLGWSIFAEPTPANERIKREVLEAFLRRLPNRVRNL